MIQRYIWRILLLQPGSITDLALEMAGRGDIEINGGGEAEALVR